MNTYIDPEDFLTKVKCSYCGIGVPVNEVVERLVRENGILIEILVGHEKCIHE